MALAASGHQAYSLGSAGDQLLANMFAVYDQGKFKVLNFVSISIGEPMTLPGIRPLTEMDIAAPAPALLRASQRHVAEVCTWLARVTPATSFLLPIEARRALLRRIGIQIGRKVTGLKQCGFETKDVSIGDGSYVNVGCWFEGNGRIEIGRNVFLGPQVIILSSIHDIDSDGQVTRTPVPGQVRIGDRCWLGARAMILPEVTIGEGTIIGAGAVVTKDCEPGAVYVGVPARRVR